MKKIKEYKFNREYLSLKFLLLFVLFIMFQQRQKQD